MRPSRDEVYLVMALVIAARGTCARRKVGCVFVDADGFVLSMGYNGVASGRTHCTDVPCPGAHHASGQGLDTCEAIHAEQNAILRLPDPRRLHTAYVTVSPCVSCVKLLLGTSCQRIVFAEQYPHSDAEAWWRSAGREWVAMPELANLCPP